MAETLEEYQARQVAEYGQFVASQNITHDGALAYVAGQSVPASNVELYSYDKSGLVERVANKSEAKKQAAQSVAAVPAGVTTE